MAVGPLVPPSKVNPNTVEEAVNALLQWRDGKSKKEKPQLLDDDEFVYLIVAFRKVPQKSRTSPYRIPIPHPLFNPVEDSSEMCLVIDDRFKSHITKDAVKKKIQSENIPISKVIRFSKLKTDYKPFEAKRKLCDSYNMFFADRRVIPLLPRHIGKQFFKKKKIPVSVDLTHKNWKEQIENACSSAMLYLRTGTCSVIKVGKTSMSGKEIAENVLVGINGVSDIIPGKWNNVRSIHLKLLESLALPVYQAVPSLKLKIEAGSSSLEDVDGESTIVEVHEDEDRNQRDEASSSKKKKKKGRIHEVRYMDSNVAEMLGDDGCDGNIGEPESSEGVEEGQKGIIESIMKKRKKESKLNVKATKKGKKAGIVKQKKADSVKQKVKRIQGKKAASL